MNESGVRGSTVPQPCIRLSSASRLQDPVEYFSSTHAVCRCEDPTATMHLSSKAGLPGKLDASTPRNRRRKLLKWFHWFLFRTRSDKASECYRHLGYGSSRCMQLPAQARDSTNGHFGVDRKLCTHINVIAVVETFTNGSAALAKLGKH
jgi:hypothetical protein